MPLVKVPELGVVSFPDTMSEEEINSELDKYFESRAPQIPSTSQYLGPSAEPMAKEIPRDITVPYPQNLPLNVIPPVPATPQIPGDVISQAPPNSVSPFDLKPAIRLVGGEIVPGDEGDTHPDIIDRDGIGVKEVDQRGFVNAQGQFFDRRAAKVATGLPSTREPENLHSTDLPGYQSTILNIPKALLERTDEVDIQERSRAINEARTGRTFEDQKRLMDDIDLIYNARAESIAETHSTDPVKAHRLRAELDQWRAKKLADIGIESVGLHEPATVSEPLTVQQQQDLFGKGLTGEALGEAQRTVQGFASALAQPEMMPLTPGAAGVMARTGDIVKAAKGFGFKRAGATLPKVVGRSYLPIMLNDLGQQIGETASAIADKDMPEAIRSLVRTGATGLMVALPLKEAIVRERPRIGKAAASAEKQMNRIDESLASLSAELGPLEKRAATPEEQELLVKKKELEAKVNSQQQAETIANRYAEEGGQKIEWDDSEPKDGGVASAKPDGTIVINRDNFHHYLEKYLGGKMTNRAVQSLITEELIHAATFKLPAYEETAAQYWNGLSSIEKWVERKIYSTEKDIDPWRMGFEAMRRRIQMAQGMTPSQFIELSRTERWTMRSLSMLGDFVRTLRESFDLTKEGRETTRLQVSALNIIEKNIQAAMKDAEQRAKGAKDASEVTQTTTPDGNVPTQPVKGAGPVSVEKGRPGIQPQTGGGLEGQAQVLLTKGTEPHPVIKGEAPPDEVTPAAPAAGAAGTPGAGAPGGEPAKIISQANPSENWRQVQDEARNKGNDVVFTDKPPGIDPTYEMELTPEEIEASDIMDQIRADEARSQEPEQPFFMMKEGKQLREPEEIMAAIPPHGPGEHVVTIQEPNGDLRVGTLKEGAPITMPGWEDAKWVGRLMGSGANYEPSWSHGILKGGKIIEDGGKSGVEAESARAKTETMPQMRMKAEYTEIGTADERGGIKAMPVPSGKVLEHREAGLMYTGARWRYDKANNQVVWSDEPSQNQIEIVNNHLYKNGISPNRHTSWMDTTLNYLEQDPQMQMKLELPGMEKEDAHTFRRLVMEYGVSRGWIPESQADLLGNMDLLEQKTNLGSAIKAKIQLTSMLAKAYNKALIDIGVDPKNNYQMHSEALDKLRKYLDDTNLPFMTMKGDFSSPQYDKLSKELEAVRQERLAAHKASDVDRLRAAEKRIGQLNEEMALIREKAPLPAAVEQRRKWDAMYAHAAEQKRLKRIHRPPDEPEMYLPGTAKAEQVDIEGRPVERVAPESAKLPRLTGADLMVKLFGRKEDPGGPAIPSYLDGPISTRKLTKKEIRKLEQRQKKQVEEGKMTTPVQPGYVCPSFKGFFVWAKNNIPGIQVDQIRAMWMDAVWNHVLKATGARLAEWRKALHLETDYGTQPIVDPMRGGTVAVPGGLPFKPTPRVFGPQMPSADRAALARELRSEADILELMSKNAPTKKELREAPKKVSTVKEQQIGFEALTGQFRQAMLSKSGEEIPAKKKQAPVKLKALESKEDLEFRAQVLRDRADIIESGGEIEGAGGPSGMTRAERAAAAQRNYRRTIEGKIATRLIEESEGRLKDLERDEITLDDLEFENDNTSEGVYVEISKKQSESLTVMDSILTEGARVKGENIDISKRVAGMIDLTDQTFHLVSAFRLPSGETMVRDPKAVSLGRAKANRKLKDVLPRYRVIVSLLVRDPLRGFHQEFPDYKSFMKAIGREAAEIQRGVDWAYAGGETEPEPVPEGEQPPEGTRPEDIEATAETGTIPTKVTRGEGGGFQGPHRDAALAQAGMNALELSRKSNSPVTAGEASSMYDWFDKQEVVELSDMEEAVAILASRASLRKETGGRWAGLRPADYQTISALNKIVRATYNDLVAREHEEAASKKRKVEPIPPEEAYHEALHRIYKIIKNPEHQVFEDYLSQVLRRYGQEPPEPFQPPSGAPRTIRPERGIQRELTLGEGAPWKIRRPELRGGLTASRRWAAPEEPAMLEGEPYFEPEKAKEYAKKPKGAVEVPSLGAMRIKEGPPVHPSRKPKPGYPDPESVQMQMKMHLLNSYNREKSILATMFKRAPVKRDIYASEDVVDNITAVYARRGGNHVRLGADKTGVGTPIPPKEQLMIRQAAKAVLATGELTHWTGPRGGLRSTWSTNRAALQGLLDDCNLGIQYATEMLEGRLPWRADYAGSIPAHRWGDKAIASKWLKAAKQLKSEVEYAMTNWTSQPLKEVVARTRKEMMDEWLLEKKNGINLRTRDLSYVPGRYEAELWNDNSVVFGDGHDVLGRNFRSAKVFRNYYEAVRRGPYIPVNYDVADLVEHRLRQGGRMVNKNLWFDMMKSLKDPVTLEPIIVDPKEPDMWVLDKKTKKMIKVKGPKQAPTHEYKLVSFDNGRRVVAVKKGFVRTVKAMSGESVIQEQPVLRSMLRFGQFLKHNGILIYDTYHPMRIAQYALATTGKDIRWKGGWSALEFKESDLTDAVRSGLVTQDAADWAKSAVNVNFGSRTVSMSRAEILEKAIKSGLNVGRLQDALFGHMKLLFPGLPQLNRFIFDRLTRGLMAESVVRNFEKYNASHPNTPFNDLMRDIVNDTNKFYGSIGRQGWIKQQWIRDISQIFFLAPQWVEGLAQKELGLYSRLLKAPFGVRQKKGLPAMGMTGKGMLTGLATYFAVTQAINLITRGKPTFMNEEEGHALDAWIPDWEGGPGSWISPMSVFAELTEQIVQLSESKKTFWDAVDRVGRNKLHPWGRMAMVLATKHTSLGEAIPTTMGRAKEAASEMVPVPITLGRPVQEILSRNLPQLSGTPIIGKAFQRPPKGAFQRQALASAVGIKAFPGRTDTSQAYQNADVFLRKNGLKRPMAEITPTVEESYAKLARAIRNEDMPLADAVYKKLRQSVVLTRGKDFDTHLYNVMKARATRPFTGSKQFDEMWISSFDKREWELYGRATDERLTEFQKFLDWFYTSHAR